MTYKDHPFLTCLACLVMGLILGFIVSIAL